MDGLLLVRLAGSKSTQCLMREYFLFRDKKYHHLSCRQEIDGHGPRPAAAVRLLVDATPAIQKHFTSVSVHLVGDPKGVLVNI